MRISQGLSVAALVAAMIGCSNVVKEPRGERSYRTFKRIEGAVGIGVSKLTYDALLQDAATELLIFRDLGEGTADSASLARYSAALDKYRDAGKLWSEQIDNARYDWMPKGAIYLTDHSIAVKYKLPTTSRKMPYTGTSYETIDSESIQSIWALAKTDVDSADARLLPDIRKAH